MKVKMYRFYIHPSHDWYECNFVYDENGKEYPYSYMCSNPEHFPPEDYELVFETDGHYRIEYGAAIQFEIDCENGYYNN